MSNIDTKRNICIAKQNLTTCNDSGKAIRNKDYLGYMASGGKVIGNVRALNSYKFEILTEETNDDIIKLEDLPDGVEILVEDDIFLKHSNLAMMGMTKKCFNKYFIVVECESSMRSVKTTMKDRQSRTPI